MAIYNEILVGRYARFLQKLFGIKGGVPAKQLAGEVMPTFPLFTGVEHRYLEQWERFSWFIFQSGGAAQNAYGRLRNPAGSNVVGVVEKLLYNNAANAAADTMQLYLNSVGADPGNLTTVDGMINTRLDTRGRPSPTLIASHQINQAVGVGTQVMSWSSLTNTNIDIILTDDQEITLLPGETIDFRNNTVNQSIAISLIWRERFLEDSERA